MKYIFALAPVFLAVQGQILSCQNAEESICDLPYDKVTFAGAKHALSYAEMAIACAQTAKECADEETKCTKTEKKCLAGTEEQCSSRCTSKFLGICFKNETRCETVCKAPEEDVCVEEETECTAEREYCALEATPATQDCYYRYQEVNMETQLADGVRVFDLDLCLNPNNAPALCVGDGDLQAVGATLEPVLESLQAWRSDNPGEIVTLVFDTQSQGEEELSLLSKNFGAVLNGSGFKDTLGHAEAPGKWPTLKQLVSNDKSVVVFLKDNLYFAEGMRDVRSELKLNSFSDHVFIPENLEATDAGDAVEKYCAQYKADEGENAIAWVDYVAVVDQPNNNNELATANQITAALNAGGVANDVCVSDKQAILHRDYPIESTVEQCYVKNRAIQAVVVAHYNADIFGTVSELNDRTFAAFQEANQSTTEPSSTPAAAPSTDSDTGDANSELNPGLGENTVSDGNNVNGGVIAGVVVGSLVVIGIIVMLAVSKWRPVNKEEEKYYFDEGVYGNAQVEQDGVSQATYVDYPQPAHFGEGGDLSSLGNGVGPKTDDQLLRK
eukprot:Clim_evm83s134 gene=Clim_evmTU83s134